MSDKSQEEYKRLIDEIDAAEKELRAKQEKLSREKAALQERAFHARVGVIDFSSLSYDQLFVLSDMLEEWSDKDRHGFLAGERNYDDDQISAVYEMSSALDKAMKDFHKRA